MPRSNKPNMTSNKGVLQAERRNPLLRDEVLEDFMLDLFKDEIQEIEGPSEQ